VTNSGRVSVIIPARNEEANIERVVRSVAGQSGTLEILVIDDQSKDRTGEILEQLQKEFAQLRVLRTESLPPAWTGKAHAVATGARVASGEWLLFTDADTEHLPGSLAELLARAENENIDLLSVSPSQETPTVWEKAVIPLIYVDLATKFRYEEVSDPGSEAAAANGQYILIRREVYEQAGGHAAVKGDVLEDVALARRVKMNGGRLLFLPGAQWVRTRMYRTFAEMWDGWTKNLFLLYGRKVAAILKRSAALWFFDVLPAVAFVIFSFAVVFGRGAPAVLAAVGCFLVALGRQWSYSRALRRIGFEPTLASYQIPGAALLGILLLNSARVYLMAGQVNWKGREYSTKDHS
jgi:glycosyltransferase involved in cell wall biosynthesis